MKTVTHIIADKEGRPLKVERLQVTGDNRAQSQKSPTVPIQAPRCPTIKRDLCIHAPLAVNIASWSICDIPYELAVGFLHYTDWAYWAVTGGQSWVRERQWWHIDTDDPQRREYRIVEDLLCEADVVHLNGHHVWPYLTPKVRKQLAGKARMAIHWHGGDLRVFPYRWEKAEHCAGYLRFVSTPDLLQYGRYRDSLTWLPSPVNLEELDRCFPRWRRSPEEPVTVGHGYTVAENKGTAEIRRTVASLRGIRPLFWHGIQRRHSLWLISQCDVYVSTLLYGPGVAAYEAMAFGIPVLAGCSEEDLVWHLRALGVERAEDLPWIYVTAETLGPWLRRLIADPHLRSYWGERGRRYVEEYHDVPRVVYRLEAAYLSAEPCRRVVCAEDAWRGLL